MAGGDRPVYGTGMHHDQEQRVIAAVLDGDAEAYGFIVRRYERPIYNLMRRMTGSEEDALDLSQEAFVKAYQKLEQFKRGSRFFPWLYSIGMNTARDFLRKRRPDYSYDEAMDSGSPADSDTEAEALQQLDLQRVAGAMEQLPVEMREALLLRYREELSFEELSQALDVSLSGAKMRVHRGLARLRAIVTEESHAA